MIVDGKKYCPYHREFHPVEDFNAHSGRSDGLQSYCRSARAAHRQQPEHLVRRSLNDARHRAKKLGLPFDIDVEYLISITPAVCPILGIPLVRSQGYGPAPGSPSIDRIVPELGYVRGNVQVISNLANSMKQNATQAQLLSFADWVYKTYRNEVA